MPDEFRILVEYPNLITVNASQSHVIHVSLMSISIPGKSAAVFYSSEIFSSRISAEFAESVTAQHFRLLLGPVVTLLFTVDVPESNISFCDKLDFIIDSLCRVDVVLGRE